MAWFLPPTTWNPSQSNCFSQLQHLKIAALVSFKNRLSAACHYLLKMLLLVLLGHQRRAVALLSQPLGEGAGAPTATCAALPLGCPWSRTALLWVTHSGSAENVPAEGEISALLRPGKPLGICALSTEHRSSERPHLAFARSSPAREVPGLSKAFKPPAGWAKVPL